MILVIVILSQLLPARKIFADSAADENELQKFRQIRNTHSECETHEFDEMTPLTPVVENVTSKNRDTQDDSSERLSAGTRRDPETRFAARER